MLNTLWFFDIYLFNKITIQERIKWLLKYILATGMKEIVFFFFSN